MIKGMEKAFRKFEEKVHTSFFYGNDDGRGVIGKDGKLVRDFEAKEFFRFFSLGDQLGQGATGKVFKATLKGTPEGTETTTYAVKRVRRWGLRESAKKALQREVSILHELVHRNVVDIYQFYPKDPQYSYIVLEFMAGGELFERIIKKESYNEMEARDMCIVLISAMGYIHERGIVHRDVKPSNILLTSRDDDATIKLADFGLACSVADKKVITKCGTPDYMAPEILLGKPHDTSVDMWSVGLVMYILLGGRHPFYESNTTKMFIRIAAADFEFGDDWTNTTQEAKDFIFRLLKADPAKRMTAAEAAAHPWLHASDNSLARVDLGNNLERIKMFQAKIKLRAMIKTVLMAQRLVSSGKFSDSFVIGKELGKGAFATVFKATGVGKASAASGDLGLPPPPTEFAVKRIDRKGLKEEDRQSVYDEARILREMTHPNVVHIERFYDNDPDYYYMVLELMAGGELFDRIVQKTFYNEEEARDLCRVLLGAIKYMHGKDVVHRDLKPENLLLASPSDDLSIRLADFGFACSVREGFVKDMCGTPAYVAPEILSAKAYGTSVDMWSMGVIIYILLCGYPPFSDESQTRMYRKIKAGRFKFHTNYWAQVSEEAKDLIKKLLIVDQTTRITAADALEHPWLSTELPSMADHDLGLGLEKLRLFNARRKLRAAIQSILLARRFDSLMSGL